MSGNVWEWCHDAYDEKIYKMRSTNENPVNWTNAHCMRVLRGGSSWTAADGVVVGRSGDSADDRSGLGGLRLFRYES